MQSTIQVAFDGALDPASVTRANIRVLSQGIPVPTRLSYDDAAHVVTIDPMGNLSYENSYTLSISGVASAGHRPVVAQQTRLQLEVRREQQSHDVVAGLHGGRLHHVLRHDAMIPRDAYAMSAGAHPSMFG
jgi:hypothetical protein